MKKPLPFLMSLILIFTLAACSAGAVETGAVANGSTTTNVVAVEAADERTQPTTESSTSAAETLAENSAVHEESSDYTWDEAAVIAIALNGDSISAGQGVTVEGSTATITAPGTYRLSGSLADGQIVVYTQDEALVQLILDGADLRSSSSSPVNIENAGKVVILLAENSQNFISDGMEYTFATAGETEPNAALFSKADLSIAGSGSLTVTGNYNDGIASKDGLVLAGGTLTVSAVDDGIRGKDYVVVEGGTLTVDAQGDGLKSDDAEDPAKGYIEIAGGTLNITAGGNAIQAETDVAVTGGALTLTAGGGSGNWAGDDNSTKGISAVVSLTVDGGTLTINSSDDALHANGSLTINGGTFNLTTGDDGIHADAAIEINGGVIDITRSYEGIESAVITLNDGDIRVVSSDDGINVAGGVDGSGGMGPGGARPGQGQQDGFTYTGGYYLYIHGGTIQVDAGGDGLDINGAIEMTGGTVLLNGPTEQMNGALDYDAGFVLSGGFIAAAGSSGMAMAPGTNSSQNSVMVYFTAAQPAGTLIHIQNSSGENVLTFAPSKQFQSLAFSSPDLVAAETYTILLGGSATGTQLGSLYQDAGYSGGAQYEQFTVSGVVTTVGTGGGMRGGPGGGRRP